MKDLLPADLREAIHAAEDGPLTEEHIRTLLWHLRSDASTIASQDAVITAANARVKQLEADLQHIIDAPLDGEADDALYLQHLARRALRGNS